MAKLNHPRSFDATSAILLVSWAAMLVASAGLVMAQNVAPGSGSRAVAITVDDLPGAVPGMGHADGDLQELQKINRVIPQTLKARHVPAIGFVNEWKLQVEGQRVARAALLQSWLDAGLSLGNHTYTHVSFFTTPLAQFEDETIRGEVVTRTLTKAAGQEEKYFRHPFLSTGPTKEAKAAFEVFLKEHGYVVAPVTVDNDDYMFNDVLCDALEKGDKELAERTKKAYFEHMNAAFEYYEELSRSLFHRDIPQILLIHASELNTECLEELLANIQRRGYRFVSLDEALADPAYATPDLFIGRQGISWLIRWKLAFGQKADFQNEPDPPNWIIQRFREIRRAKQER